MSIRCENCGRRFKPKQRVILLRQVTAIVAPDDPDGYIITDRTRDDEAIHARCPKRKC